MGRLDGKVAFITGAARGQGRGHAVLMAREGADIIALDICAQVPTVGYPMSTADDLAETVRLVEQTGRRIVATETDVRDGAAMRAAVENGVARLGRLDIVVANAGIMTLAPFEKITEQMWDDIIGIDLSGVFKTVRAALPHLKATGDGGAIVLIGSTSGLHGYQHLAHYVAAKHGVAGLTKTLANELARHRIRVNAVHPTTVDTPMIHNEYTYGVFAPGRKVSEVTREEAAAAMSTAHALPVGWVEASDIGDAVLWLVSDAARYVTGVQLPIDAGATVK